MKQYVAILDLGTSKLTVLVGSRGINNSIHMEGLGVCEYDGFREGVFIAPEKLCYAVAQAVAAAESSARAKINRLYIGVPADFLDCTVKDVSIAVSNKKRVLPQDIEALHARGNDYNANPQLIPIHIQPIYYTLDDGRKLISPEGMPSTGLAGSISYIAMQRSFADVVDTAVKSAGISETEYVATPLAEMHLLFDDYTRDHCVMLADCGANSSSLVIGRGDGLCRLYYFPWGGNRITTTLAKKFEISFAEAERLKREVILSLDADYVPKDDLPGLVTTEYRIEYNNELHTFPVKDVNEAVRYEILLFSLYVEKALKICDYDYPDFIPLSLTGGGLGYMRGATEYLSICVHREVELKAPLLPLLDRPHLSSPFGLLNMVLDSEEPQIGAVDKIKRWFSRRA